MDYKTPFTRTSATQAVREFVQNGIAVGDSVTGSRESIDALCGDQAVIDAAKELLYKVEDHLRAFDQYDGNPVPFNKRGAGVRAMAQAAKDLRAALRVLRAG